MTTQPRMAVSSVGGAPGCLLLLFCCRTLVVAGAWWKGCSRIAPASFLLTQFGGYRKNGAGLSQTARVRQRKEEGGASGRDPNFCNCRIWLNGQIPQVSAKPKPRNRRCERSGRSPECRRQSLFLLHHQNPHSLFPLQEKENGGFEAGGLPRHFPAPRTGRITGLP